MLVHAHFFATCFRIQRSLSFVVCASCFTHIPTYSSFCDIIGEVEAKENKGNLEGPRQNSPPRQPFRASQAPHQQQPWGQPQPLAKPWAQHRPQQHPWDPPQSARHQWGQAASQTREAADPWGQQQYKAVVSMSMNQAIMLRTLVACLHKT